MAGSKARKWSIIAAGVVLVLGVGGIIGFWTAVWIIKGKVVEAL